MSERFEGWCALVVGIVLWIMLLAAIFVPLNKAEAAPVAGRYCAMYQWGYTNQATGLTCVPNDGVARWSAKEYAPYAKARMTIARKNRTIAALRVAVENERIDNEYYRKTNLALSQVNYKLILENERLRVLLETP